MSCAIPRGTSSPMDLSDLPQTDDGMKPPGLWESANFDLVEPR